MNSPIPEEQWREWEPDLDNFSIELAESLRRDSTVLSDDIFLNVALGLLA